VLVAAATPPPTAAARPSNTADGERVVDYGAAWATREGLDLRLVHVPYEYAYDVPMIPYLPSDKGA
jgi:hypothetical protein